MFPKLEDIKKELGKWEYWINRIEKIKDLTNSEKDNITKSFLKGKKILGEDFFEIALEKKHPILEELINQAPWNQKYWAWFFSTLHDLQECKNFNILIEELNNEIKFSPSILEFTYAYYFYKSGFSVEFFPSIEYRDKKRKPDFKIINSNTNEEIYTEVSEISMGKIEGEAYKTFETLGNFFSNYVFECLYSGRVYKPLSVPRLEELKTKLKKIIEAAKETENLQVFVEPRIIKVAIAPKSKKEEIEKWSKENRLHGIGLSGPEFDVDEINRIKNKIDEKQDQLPRDILNILIIKHNRFFTYNKDMVKGINLLEEKVFNHPHIILCAIIGSGLKMVETNLNKFNGHLFGTIQRHYFVGEDILLLFNKYTNRKELSNDSYSKIISSFKIEF